MFRQGGFQPAAPVARAASPQFGAPVKPSDAEAAQKAADRMATAQRAAQEAAAARQAAANKALADRDAKSRSLKQVRSNTDTRTHPITLVGEDSIGSCHHCTASTGWQSRVFSYPYN